MYSLKKIETQKASSKEKTRKEAFSETKSMFELAPYSVFIFDGQGRILYGNKAVELAFEQRINRILGFRIGSLFECIHAGNDGSLCGTTEFCSVCGMNQGILECKTKKEAVTKRVAITFKNRKTLGAKNFSFYITPIEDGEEEALFATITNEDDTERRRIYERVFFHDLLNTAGGLKNLEYLRQFSSSTEEREEMDQMIKDTIEVLVEQILNQKELVAAENSELKVKPIEFSVKEFMDTLIYQYKEQEISQNKKIERLTVDDFYFSSDTTLLRRVLENMLKNALEASKEGDIVSVGYKLVGHRAEFWIHNPSFIPKEIQLQLFKRSFSTKGTGRGLGTYSMKLLGEGYLKGRISFESTEEEGTTFVAVFPTL